MKDKPIILTGYVIRFDEPDINGNIFKKDAIDVDYFEHAKLNGRIIDYRIDEYGVEITTAVKELPTLKTINYD